MDARRKAGYLALDAMERELAGRDFLLGDGYTIADIALYAYTHIAGEGGFDLVGYPAISGVAGARGFSTGPHVDHGLIPRRARQDSNLRPLAPETLGWGRSIGLNLAWLLGIRPVAVTSQMGRLAAICGLFGRVLAGLPLAALLPRDYWSGVEVSACEDEP